MNASHLTDIHANDSALTARDLHNVWGDAHVGAWVKPWLHCGWCGKYMLHCVDSEFDCAIVCSYKEVEYEKDL